MTPERELTAERVPKDKSVIAVSDLHFGGPEDNETVTRFCRFLDAIHSGNLQVSRTGDDAKTCPDHLLPPAKIILLGDILELWDSRKQDRNNAFLDAILPFMKLRELPCDIIYVTGNHDEDVGEIVTTVYQAQGKESGAWTHTYSLFCGKEDGKRVVESLKIQWTNEHICEISPRHYPAVTTGGPVKGLKSGGIHYSFFHGQQFDGEQIMHTLSRAAGHRIDIIDNLQDLASCSVAKDITKYTRLAGMLAVSVVIIWLYFSAGAFPYSLAAQAVGAITGLIAAIILAKGIYLFGFTKKGEELPSSRWLLTLCAGLFIAECIAVVAGWLVFSTGMLMGFFSVAFVLALYSLFVITIPVTFAKVKKDFYNGLNVFKSLTIFSGLNVRNQESEQIYKNALKSEKYRHKAEVLVFGHTHVDDNYLNVKHPGEKEDTRSPCDPALMINTGTWVHEEGKEYIDSFVYIDRTGVAAMRWRDDGIQCRKHFPAETIAKIAEEIRALPKRTAAGRVGK